MKIIKLLERTVLCEKNWEMKQWCAYILHRKFYANQKLVKWFLTNVLGKIIEKTNQKVENIENFFLSLRREKHQWYYKLNYV